MFVVRSNNASSSSARNKGKFSFTESNSLCSFYFDPPTKELSLDEFELLALDRLNLLRSVETLKSRGFEGKELKEKVLLQEKKIQMNHDKHTSLSRFSKSEIDTFGHFILRLAYCHTEDLRRWFLLQEGALFRCRLDGMSDQERQAFMHENSLHFEEVSAAEVQRKKDKLLGVGGIANEVQLLQSTFYRIPFLDALTLVQRREVYLEGGFAYVPLGKLVAIIRVQYRMHLSRALSEAANKFEIAMSDTRIGSLLKNISKQYIGNDFTKNTTSDRLTAESVEAATQHMPLCMRTLHNALKRDHKLKHWGRLQYGLFLKAAGLDMDETVKFMESHFTKSMSHEQFQKNYGYMWRHMHGKEGARKNYTPYSCVKIVLGAAPEPGAFHGCPYKHMPDGQLTSLLTSLSLSTQESKELVDIAKSGHFQVACQRHFDLSHPGHETMGLKQMEGVANHPNQWYLASVAYGKAKKGTATSLAAVKEETSPAEA